ncbi:Dihydroxyacetone synthase, partial [Ceratobasidium sp. 394]
MRVGSLVLLFSTAFGLAAAATPHRRSTDTCANIKLSFYSMFEGPAPHIESCACINGVDQLINSSFDLKFAAFGSGSVTGFGPETVRDGIITSINRGRDKRECTYPDYAIPSCTSQDVCNYSCPPDRIKLDGRCACQSGMNECNGQCTTNVCSSQMSKARHARSKRGKHCPSGSEVCSVPGTLDGWECVKTHEDLESCGGCAFPFFPGQKPGVDCSALPGVHTVACIQ